MPAARCKIVNTNEILEESQGVFLIIASELGYVRSQCKTLLHRRMQNRMDIEQSMRTNKGTAKIFGLYKKVSLTMLFVSISDIGETNGKLFVILHSFDPTGVFMSNICIFTDDIESICPPRQHGK